MNYLRYARPERGRVFLVMPFGKKNLSNGEEFDFEEFHSKSLVPAVEGCSIDGGSTVVERADDIYGPPAVMDRIWRGMQRADVVVVVFSGRAPNVALEFGMALILGKRMIILAHDLDDVPSDVRGLYHVILFSSYWTDMQRMTDELKKQLIAISDEPVTEMALIPMGDDANGAQPAAATVEAVHEDFAVVRADDGRRGLLGLSDVSYSKIPKDMRGFREGQRLQGAFVSTPHGGTRYSLLAGTRNPWEQLEKSHGVGHCFISTVHSVRETIGVFVRVDGAINGLIPARTVTAWSGLARDARVEVEVTGLHVERRQVELRLVRVLTPAVSSVTDDGGTAWSKGFRTYGRVLKVVPEEGGRRGGFLKVELRNKRCGILHCSMMGEDLRHDLNNGFVDVGEEILVEISRIDPSGGRIELREADDEASSAA
ncbi:hypothetical protein AB0M29_36620 [Streptomyces sp. NPDC051976]|uniref:hypothetical protein n=1 Tax=Streptomyces sp. NPDC051976 TaxID=3154947 RepID=UPI003419AD2A